MMMFTKPINTRPIHEFPWHNLVHFYGRCDDFPELFNQLIHENTSLRQQAAKQLVEKIEHQDGFIIATPFTVLILFRLLKNHVMAQNEILSILQRIALVCNEKITHLNETEAAHSLDYYLQDGYLWADFVSEEEDEMQWEEWEMPADSFDDFVFLCAEIFRNSVDVLRGIDNPQAKAILQYKAIFQAA